MVSWTLEQYKEHLAESNSNSEKSKTSKYKNKPTTVDGIYFHSTTEANRYLELKLMQRAGIIKDLERQVAFQLGPAVRFSDSTSDSIKSYVADFVYTVVETNKKIVEDVKSTATANNKEYLLKKHFMLLFHEIEIYEHIKK